MDFQGLSTLTATAPRGCDENFPSHGEGQAPTQQCEWMKSMEVGNRREEAKVAKHVGKFFIQMRDPINELALAPLVWLECPMPE